MTTQRMTNDPEAVQMARDVIHDALCGAIDPLVACLRIDSLRPGLMTMPGRSRPMVEMTARAMGLELPSQVAANSA